MRKTTLVSLLLVAAGLVGCPTNNTTRDSGTTPPVDTGVPPVDTGVPPVDTGTPMDSGTPATDVPIASVVNASAADHPMDGSTVHVTGNLVALSTRLFISQSATSNRCLYAIWVGTVAGGDHSGIQVTESFDAPPNGCFDQPAHQIPDTISIGDAVTTLTGRFINFCPSGTSCPPNTAQELDVTNGAFAAGAHVGDPMATDVTIADVSAMGLTPAPRDMALQGAVVHLSNTVVVDPPSMANHNVMSVAAMGTTTPVMYIQISKYPGVTCQRTVLSGSAAGTAVGDITGVLQYSFGQWTIQPRQSADLPGIMCMDAGTGGADAGV